MYTLNVESMNCKSCVAKINRALTEFDPAAQIEIDLAQAKIKISSDESAAEICDLLANLGYPARVAL